MRLPHQAGIQNDNDLRANRSKRDIERGQKPAGLPVVYDSSHGPPSPTCAGRSRNPQPVVLNNQHLTSNIQLGTLSFGSRLQNLPQRGAEDASAEEIGLFLVPAALFRGYSRLLQLPLGLWTLDIGI